MKENSLLLSLLAGLITVLLIAGVSLLVKINKVSSSYSLQVAKTIDLEKQIKDTQDKNVELEEGNLTSKKEIETLRLKIAKMEEEKLQLEQKNKKLEDSLKKEEVTKENVSTINQEAVVIK